MEGGRGDRSAVTTNQVATAHSDTSTPRTIVRTDPVTAVIARAVPAVATPTTAPVSTVDVRRRAGSTAVVTYEVSVVAGRIHAIMRRRSTACSNPEP
ncbi:hypothetical protein RhoFasK5_03553|nr:hypothetical protein [Rhodococcus kroppenstedtii]